MGSASNISNAGAQARALCALVLLEEAQNKLTEASQQLSSIVGMAPDCDKVWSLRQRVHGYWYKLQASIERKKHRIHLDGANLAALEKRHGEKSEKEG